MEGNRVLGTRVSKSRLNTTTQTPAQQKHEQNHLHSCPDAGADGRSASLALSHPASQSSSLPCFSFFFFFLSERYFSDREQIQRGRKLDAASSPLPRYCRRLKFSHYFSSLLYVWGQRRGWFREEGGWQRAPADWN